MSSDILVSWALADLSLLFGQRSDLTFDTVEPKDKDKDIPVSQTGTISALNQLAQFKKLLHALFSRSDLGVWGPRPSSVPLKRLLCDGFVVSCEDLFTSTNAWHLVAAESFLKDKESESGNGNQSSGERLQIQSLPKLKWMSLCGSNGPAPASRPG